MADVSHKFIDIDGVEIFYREAGAESAPAVLLLHGFPSSSIQYRYLLLELADRFHVIAPDFPAFGLSAAPAGFEYSFENLAAITAAFLDRMELKIHAIYLHDYGAHVGFRLMTDGVIAPNLLIIQNSESYENSGWKGPMAAIGARIGQPAEDVCIELRKTLLNEAGIRKEFVENLNNELVVRIDPTVIALAWQKIANPAVLHAMLSLHLDYGSNIDRYRINQEFLRRTQPRALIIWGSLDQYVSVEAAEAYKRDLHSPVIQIFDGGHWLLETHSLEVNQAVREFLVAAN